MKLKLTEADLIRAINDYLQYQRNQGKLMYIRNNTGAIPIADGKTKRRFIRFGDKGSPDFLVWKPSVRWAYPTHMGVDILRSMAIEVKSETGRQSKEQKIWQADFAKLGGEYFVVRSVEKVIKIIEGR